MSLESRAATIEAKAPDLVAEIALYPAGRGGRETPIAPGYCGRAATARDAAESWEYCPQLGAEWLSPGESRRVGVVFLAGPEGADAIRAAGRFYIFEGARIIGEATVST